MPGRADLLLSSISGFQCPNCQSKQCWVINSKPSQRLNSLTAEASCLDCGHAIFIKKMNVIDGVPASQCAEREYKAACQLDVLFKKSPEFGVVAPLERIGPVLIFEHIVGIAPVGTLKTAPLDEAALVMRRLGRWFANLHDASDKGKPTGDLAGRFEAMVSWSTDQKHNPVAAQALRYLETHLPGPEPGDYRYCQLHGDAKPENFLLERDRVVGIDIGWRFLQLPENDLAQFLTQYELSVCGFLGKLEKSRRQILANAFLDGYRYSAPIDESILRWLRVYFMLHLWFRVREASILHRLRWDTLFKRRMESLLFELHDT